MRQKRATRRHDTRALVLRRTPYGEADLVLTAFTEELGRVSILARAARKSQRRFGGRLEPLHTLRFALVEAVGSELLSLSEANLDQPRTALLGSLSGMQAAGRFLGWIRHSAPEHTREPALWALAQSCLDSLEAASRTEVESVQPRPSPELVLAAHGLALLSACGWRLELERCVQSGVRCPEGKAAMIDPARGGLISRARGGAPFSVSGVVRGRLIAAQAGDPTALLPEDAELALSLVQRCLEAHAGLS